jgi:hypothetical protein
MTDDPHETVFPLPAWLVIIAFLLFGLWPTAVFSEPLFQTRSETVTLTLHSEPCQIKEVSNLPRRATWEEKGKVIEGCWQLFGHSVGLYFIDDRTVGVAPAEAFKKVVGV